MLGIIRFNKETKYQPWHGYLLLGIIFIAIVLGVVQKTQKKDKPVVMSQATCEKAGGNWNACGSACRGSDDPCIEVCIAQCECTENNECPTGYSCTDFIDNTGICSKSFQ